MNIDEIRELDLRTINKLLGRIDMGRMSYIAKLCEDNNLKELTEEVGSVEVAQAFIDAHTEMRLQKNNPAFKKLNEIHDDMMQEVAKDEG
jgi:maltose-binding protein MalE